MGTMRTTPPAALEVMLDLSPLHIFVMRRSSSYTQANSGANSNKPMIRSRKLYEKLQENFILGMPVDYTVSIYNFTKNFIITIPIRGDWKKGLNVKAGKTWYINGSKFQRHLRDQDKGENTT